MSGEGLSYGLLHRDSLLVHMAYPSAFSVWDKKLSCCNTTKAVRTNYTIKEIDIMKQEQSK